MPDSSANKQPMLASPWVAFLGLFLSALGLTRAMWADGPDIQLILPGLFFTTLSAHTRAPAEKPAQRRVLEVAMAVLLIGMLAEAFV